MESTIPLILGMGQSMDSAIKTVEKAKNQNIQSTLKEKKMHFVTNMFYRRCKFVPFMTKNKSHKPL